MVHNPADCFGEDVNPEPLAAATGQLEGVRQSEEDETIASAPRLRDMLVIRNFYSGGESRSLDGRQAKGFDPVATI